MEYIKWSGSERVSQECSEDILIKVIDMIDTFLESKERERKGLISYIVFQLALA